MSHYLKFHWRIEYLYSELYIKYFISAYYRII